MRKKLAILVLAGGVLLGASASALAGDVTKAEYSRVQMGMSYQQVVAILGPPDEALSETEMAGFHTIMYMWEGRGGFGANMNAMFQNGRLVNKAQFGLR